MPGKWHKDWQDSVGSPDDNEWKYQFHPPTDKYYDRKAKKEYRQCDTRLNYQTTIEFQHSRITKDEIKRRKLEWRELGKEIIWMLDGKGNEIKISEWSGEHIDGSRFLLEDIPNWMIYPFIKEYDYVLLDFNGKIFKIQPKYIKFKMCTRSSYKTKEEVLCLFDNLKEEKISINDFWDNWSDKKENIGSFIRVQKGAGNGKTYALWKSILENKNKRVFILLTKVITGVRVLFEELEAQRERGEAHLFNMENEKLQTINSRSPKYIISYTHSQTGRNIKIVLGTIDSFSCALTDVDFRNYDVFNVLQRTIYKKGITKINKLGEITYAKQKIKINKETQIWIDEAQDLSLTYFNSFVKIILQTGVDIGFVGDKLQSLHYEHNIFTKTKDDFKSVENEIGFIDIEPINHNRRIKTTHLAEEINKIVRYKKFDCLPIQNTNDTGLEAIETRGDQIFRVFSTPTTYGINDPDRDKKAKAQADIMLELVSWLVNRFNATPEQFLFPFIIVSNNPVIDELNSKLEEFWIKMFDNDEYLNSIDSEYWKKNNHRALNKSVDYVQFHRSQHGQSIDLTESEYKTRIVSVLTSKGMGRRFVFTCGVTSQTLKLCSEHIQGLMYESYLNVSITRATHYQFFQLTPNNDDIHHRFMSHKSVLFLPDISDYLDINKILRNSNKSKFIKLLQDKDISDDFLIDSERKEMIDFNHHCTRDSAWKTCLMFKIYWQSMDDDPKSKKQLQIIFDKIAKLPIKEKSVKEYHKFLNSFRGLANYKNEFKFIPVMKKHKENGKKVFHPYKRNLDKIIKRIRHVQANVHNQADKFSASLDYILFDHLISMLMYKHKAQPSINTLYTLTDLFEDDKAKSKQDFYNLLLKINSIIDKFLQKVSSDYGAFEWNIYHKIQYNGKNSEFVIKHNGIPIIGWNDSYVMHLVLKPTVNLINFWDTILDIIIERFMISNPLGNPNKEKDNIVRYSGKKIITYLFILETGQYISMTDFLGNLHNTLKSDIIDFIKESIIDNYNLKHKELYNYTSKIIDAYKEKSKSSVYIELNCKIYGTPFEFLLKISEEKGFPSWCVNIYKKMLKLWRKKKKDEVKKIYSTEEIFCCELNDELETSLNMYLGIENIDEDDDDF